MKIVFSSLNVTYISTWTYYGLEKVFIDWKSILMHFQMILKIKIGLILFV